MQGIGTAGPTRKQLNNQNLCNILLLFSIFSAHRGDISNMALELHNLPPWSEDTKKAVVQQLQLDVRKTLSTKPDIRPPVVQFHTSIGVSEPIYEELSISKSEIRLLDLALTEDDSPIICSLVPVSLNSAPEYAALSYEWGDAANREEILVNGHPFQARSNLIAALRQFRKTVRSSSNHDSSKAIRLWVDAVCIYSDR